MAKPVMFPPGRSSRATTPAGDGVAHSRKDDRDRLRRLLDGNGRRGRGCHDDVGLQADQLLRECSHPIGVIAAPTKVDPHVAAIGPTQVRERFCERRYERLRCCGIVFVGQQEHADAPHPLGLLRPPHH